MYISLYTHSPVILDEKTFRMILFGMSSMGVNFTIPQMNDKVMNMNMNTFSVDKS